ncbi:MAG: TetR family transcriptional regulator [Actinobacteria bacterium]|uniref:Unannotated protein n=1 Tax=freshwater metagenome TaxID=449393 RepID=A0A6J6QMY6_9ZZZZ|nr:TetR family transcriptional regulator [Actinomycetota bacterium]
MTPAETATLRPRIEGEREQEIFEAAIDVLAEVGYDRLTMDAVAARAKASKATLYRRWNGKIPLLIDALLNSKEHSHSPADTGTLRGDLLEMFCGMGGLTDHDSVAVFGSVVTALCRDEEFAAAFRTEFIGPKSAASHAMFERARARGEIGEHVDLDLLAPALAGIVMHRVFMLGELPDEGLVERVIDQIILPAATHRPDTVAGARTSHTRTSPRTQKDLT